MWRNHFISTLDSVKFIITELARISTKHLLFLPRCVVKVTSPMKVLSSSGDLGWSHRVSSNMWFLKSRLWTWEYTKVWFHLGSTVFFTALVRRLLLSLKRKNVLTGLIFFTFLWPYLTAVKWTFNKEKLLLIIFILLVTDAAALALSFHAFWHFLVDISKFSTII